MFTLCLKCCHLSVRLLHAAISVLCLALQHRHCSLGCLSAPPDVTEASLQQGHALPNTRQPSLNLLTSAGWNTFYTGLHYEFSCNKLNEQNIQTDIFKCNEMDQLTNRLQH